MKIGFDAKRLFHNSSGLGNYSRDLVRILSRFLPDNEYLLFDRKASPSALLHAPNVSFCPLRPGLFARQLAMGREAEMRGCDIFHGLSGELPLYWGGDKIKKVVTIHDLIFLRYPEYYRFTDRKIHAWKFQRAAETADAVVAISEQTKADIIRLLKVPEEKIQVIYQGCNAAFQIRYSEERKAEVRSKFKLPEKFLLNVGTLEERKNGVSIAEAVKGTDLPQVFIGRETPYTAAIRKIAGQRYFLKDVSTEELAVIYQLATIFIYPSVYEGFGIPVIEALFSGTPVITNRDGVFREAGGPASVYVDVKDTAQLRREILRLWDNEPLRRKMSEEGEQYVQKFSDAPVAAQWKALYQKIAQ